jgi:hypothetical protein
VAGRPSRFGNHSIPKEFLEPLRRQGGIARRILNVAMPEIGLDRARVVAVVGELVAAAVAQHVGVQRKSKGSALANTFELSSARLRSRSAIGHRFSKATVDFTRSEKLDNFYF